MSVVGVRALKQNASEVLREVGAGEKVTVTDRGKPVAQIVPFLESPAERLLARALAQQAKRRWSEVPLPITDDGANVASDVLRELRESE